MVIWEQENKSVALLYPSEECLLSKGAYLIALKDVPEGRPFWIVSEDVIPADFTFSDAWEVPEEWGDPDGYGSQYNTFEELENAEN